MNLVVSHWSANVAVLAGCLLVTAVHLAGLLGLRADARHRGVPVPPGLGQQAVAFYFGLLAVVIALVSPLGYYAGTFIWVRTLQALLLGIVAPALLVLGAPWLVLWRGLGRRALLPGTDDSAAAAGSVPPRWRSWPVAVTALFTLVWVGWYVPPLYDAGVHHPLVLAAQVVSYLGVGVLFWLQLIGSRPFSPQFGPLHRVMLIASCVVTGTILGMVLGFDPHVLYPAYLGVGHHRVLSVPFDQQAGGAELWVLMLLPYVITGIALLIQWVNVNEEDTGAVSLGLERILRPPKSTWPARTGWR
jgi:cytochrome c oxidase assembly factor CtaG